MSRYLSSVLLALAAAGADARLGEEELNMPKCPPAGFSTVSNFDLDAFIRSRWHIQQQQPLLYLPESENRCVYAEYSLPEKKSFWQWLNGYEVAVHNHAEEVLAPHKVHDSGTIICAKIVDKEAGKLEVAPCFIPTLFSGAYWIIDWSDEEGYALISGGPPTHSAPGGCRTGSSTNDSGLWIFTRQQKRDEALIQKVRGIAATKGFDLSVLNDVDNSNCDATRVVV